MLMPFRCQRWPVLSSVSGKMYHAYLKIQLPACFISCRFFIHNSWGSFHFGERNRFAFRLVARSNRCSSGLPIKTHFSRDILHFSQNKINSVFLFKHSSNMLSFNVYLNSTLKHFMAPAHELMWKRRAKHSFNKDPSCWMSICLSISVHQCMCSCIVDVNTTSVRLIIEQLEHEIT